jgi:hypothetical protein
MRDGNVVKPVNRDKSASIHPIFAERKVNYSDLFINLVGWHAGAVSFPPSDVI